MKNEYSAGTTGLIQSIGLRIRGTSLHAASGRFARAAKVAFALLAGTFLNLAMPNDAFSQTGAAEWSTYCAKCHTTISGGRVNVANAPAVIDNAISVVASMHQPPPNNIAASPTEKTNIATYVASQIGGGTLPLTVLFNSSAQIDVSSYLALNTAVSAFTTLQTSTGPAKGTVSYSGTGITYTANAGQTGSDSFSYYARNNAGTLTSSIRIINVTILPANDSFASAALLSGGSTSATANNATATKEAGEPNHAGNAGGHSLWWSWTAPSTNPVTLYTCYSQNIFFGNPPTLTVLNLTFDTLLAVYTGSAVNALAAVASNDDGGANCAGSNINTTILRSSYLTFNATQGTTYKFAVDGFAGATGNIKLTLYQEQTLRTIAFNAVGASGNVVSDVGGINCTNTTCTNSFAPGTTVTLTATPGANTAFAGWLGACSGYSLTCVVTVNAATTALANFQAMPNDNFANRTVLAPATTSAFGYNSTATKEAGEPNHGNNVGGKSVWWAWTPTATGTVTISTAGSDFDTTLGVYTGSAVNALTTVATNDDSNGTFQSSVTFYALAGTQYQIAVDGYAGNSGTISLSITRPANDNFANRFPLSGGTVTVLDVNTAATREVGEPLIPLVPTPNPGGHSLWWTWTAPVTGSVTIDTSGSSFDTILGVYTGTALGSLASIAANDDCGVTCTLGTNSKVTFNASAGFTYQITVDGYNGANGTVQLNILQRQPQTINFPLPANQIYGVAPYAPTVSASSGLAVSLASSTTAVCTAAGTTVTIVAAGTCTLVASQVGNASYFPAADVTQSFTVAKAPQAITFNAQASQNFSNGGTFLINPAATASSGLAISYTTNSAGVCTITGGTVAMVSTGACSISANQSGSGNYNAAATVTQVITINPGPQTISFGAQAPVSFAPGGSVTINPLATSTSGLAVTYTVTPPPVCSVVGQTVTMLSSGTCAIAANQGGNGNFNPAPTVTQNLLINATVPGAPVIGIATKGDAQAAIAFAPPATNGGSAILNYTASCSANGQPTRAGSAAASPITVALLTNGTQYSCSVTATNAVGTGGSSASVNVTPDLTAVPPQITSLASATFTITQAGIFTVTATGTPAPTLSLSGTLPNVVTFNAGTGVLSGTPAAGTAGSYPVTISATNGSGTVMQSFTLTVQKAGQTINFGNPGSQSFTATPLALVAAASPSNLTVAFASNTPATCTVSGSNLTMVSVGSCTIVASQTGDGSYSAAPSVQQTFAINAGPQSISFPFQTVASRTFAPGGIFAISPLATASSGLAIAYSSTTPAVCSVSGSNVSMIAAGNCTIAADQGGNGNYAAAVQATRSVTINGTVPDAPVIGTATPGDTQAGIAFTPPVNTGGSPISQYKATCNPGGLFATGVASPISVTGLTNNTTYTCSVTATNGTGTSVASGTVQVTPFTATGSTLWTGKCVGCHATVPPAGNRLNGGGSTENVLNYVIIHQALMAANAGVTALTANERAAIAAYILSVAPPVTGTTPINTPLPLDVGSNLVLNSATGTFTSVEVVTAPAHGTLSVAGFTGTAITYTPNNSYSGSDSFTYRGRNIVAGLSGDPRSVSITVLPAAPLISPANPSTSGTVFQPLNYQITASNQPSAYGATGLPAGLGLDMNTGLISGTPTVAGVFNVGISASNAGGTDNKTLSLNIGRAAQIIVFPAQTVASRSFSPGATFGINPLATGGGSNNAITYGSSTPAVCTVTGTTVTMVFGGTCTLTADQLGSSTYLDAFTATQVVTITPVQPGPPVIGSATPGDSSATVSFSAPAATGGAAITQYTVTCNNGALPATGAASPITVTQLTNGVQYSCSVTATSAGGTSVASGTVLVTPTQAGVAPVFTSSNAATFTITQVGNFVVTASGTPAPVLSSSGTLPNNVSFSAGTGILSGTPVAGTAGTYPITFSASNASGSPTQSFTLTVQKATQSIAFANPGAQNVGGSVMLSATASLSGLTVSFVSSTPATCTVAGSNAAMIAVGSCTIIASQSGDSSYAAAASVPQTFLIGMGGQSITFPAQSPAAQSYAPGKTFPIFPLATASSSLPLTYSSASPGVCSVSGTTVTTLSTGTCVIAANQSGDANYTAAVQATSNVTITAGSPTAPTITSVVAGDTKALVNFNPPADTGGSAITQYTATCGASSAMAATSPIVVTGLGNGSSVNCTVKATNAIGTGPDSPGVMVTPLLNTGTTLWTQICTACHITPPTVPQLNAAGSTSTVLSYVIANVQTMAAVPAVSSLTNAEKIAIAQYLQTQLPTGPEVTPYNASKLIDLISQIAVGGISFQTLEVVAMPQHGTLSAFTGTTITYTPTPGYVGPDSFTFRGVRTTPTGFVGDTRTLNVTVQPPPPPVITSLTSVSGTNGVAFQYQITATNAPASFTANGLPSGLAVNTSTGLISGTPSVGGTFPVDMTATNSGGSSPVVQLTITLNPTSQVITFPAQTPASQPFSLSPGNTFPIFPLATASSGLAVSYVSKTAGICSVSGTTVTILAAGTCTIGANQAGDASFTVATEVLSSVTINAVVPGAPVIGTATAGDRQIAIAFAPPLKTGGTNISLYTATCTPSGVGTNTVSPIVVSGLTNNQPYQCSVTATNSAGTGPASGFVSATPVPTQTPLTITSAINTTFTVNAPGSFTVTATGTPSPTSYAAAGTLPAGVTFNASNGVLSGTPTQAGSFPITFTLANGVNPAAVQNFTLTVSSANQTISFNNPGTRTFGSGPVALSALATSGLPVSFASDTPLVCGISGLAATMLSAGTCTVRAQQAGDANYTSAADVVQSFSVLQGAQTITFAAQASPLPFVFNANFFVSPPATASSGLAVSYSSLTTSVCTVVGTKATMVRAGICTIAADQPGNASVSAAPQVSQSVMLTGTVPGAPVLQSATAGDTRITLAFTAPASDGGGTISSYAATCGANTVSGPASPLAVTGLTNGTSYNCSVTATNAFGTSAPSAVQAAIPAASPGAVVWANTCSNCHSFPPPGLPQGIRLNAGGSTAGVLNYVIPRVLPMSQTPYIANMSQEDRTAVADYIREFIPDVAVTTPYNAPVDINVGNQVYLNTQTAAFTALETVTLPVSGTLSAFTGTSVTYTPVPGFTGTDTFTYRATQAELVSDVRTVSVTVLPAAPLITSALAASGTVGLAFNYQIAANNAPTSYGATGLPAGLAVDMNTGAISGVPLASGVNMVSISATGAGGSGSATLALTIGLTPQIITFGAQTASRAYSPGGTFAIAPTATGGGSANAVSYSSLTTGVCTVSGTLVTIVSAGICTIAADQAGDSTYAAATQIQQGVTIAATPPGAPTIINPAVAGNTQATISFTPPANTGGLPIKDYVVNCNGVIAGGGVSPITVSGLTNGVTYSCTVQASNVSFTGPSSGSVSVTPVAITFTNRVQSRKQHGANIANVGIVDIDPAIPITGAVNIESRTIGAGHRIAFQFSSPPSSVNSISLTDKNGGVIPGASASPSFVNDEMIVILTGIPDGKRVKITALGVNGAVDVSASIGFLVGDVSASGSVTAADISFVKSRASQPFDLARFRADINADGAVTTTDVTAVKAQAGRQLQ